MTFYNFNHRELLLQESESVISLTKFKLCRVIRRWPPCHARQLDPHDDRREGAGFSKTECDVFYLIWNETTFRKKTLANFLSYEYFYKNLFTFLDELRCGGSSPIGAGLFLTLGTQGSGVLFLYERNFSVYRSFCSENNMQTPSSKQALDFCALSWL